MLEGEGRGKGKRCGGVFFFASIFLVELNLPLVARSEGVKSR